MRVCVIDMPGLSEDLLKKIPPETALGKWLSGKKAAALVPSFPAVTCSMQATLTTGQTPEKHGIIANGLPTFRFPQDQALIDASSFAAYRKQISFWEQSNQLVEWPRFWQDAQGKSRWKTALLFLQNSMPGFAGKPKPAADIVVTPKPEHGPDGKITSLCWSNPSDLVPQLFHQLGPFPLMNYWGPMAGIASSKWIATASAIVWRDHAPQLQWTYIPHLDYDLQRFGPNSPQATQAVADAAAAIEPLMNAVQSDGGKIVLLSEYAMTEVRSHVQPNRLLAEAGLLKLRETPDGMLIDYTQSPALAMVDHQIAHVYAKDVNAIKRAQEVLTVSGIAAISPPPDGLRHRRAGDLILQADPDAWFDYRWWPEPNAAPAFAGLVDIHRKPGYDPLELFWDPANKSIIQDATKIKGSHGLPDSSNAIYVSEEAPQAPTIRATSVATMLTKLLETPG
ncbi:MAG: alkaline phosphatase family protein [Planctomycetota bacterium]|nr:alkaline phosphatase family protein [Planctomycetota bacterium]